MNVKYPERKLLAHLPTPLEKLERLSRHLGGPDIYMKRDDQTGLATGGNKTRKLEFLVADALAQGCDHLVTTGAPQSNHCRQTAAAAAHFGLGCSLVLRGKRTHSAARQSAARQTARRTPLLDRRQSACSEVMAEVANEQRVMGHSPYLIPLGGSNVMGATSYVLAMQELMAQLAATSVNIDFIVFASSSGGTQAGIVLGAEVYGFRGHALGISVDHPADDLQMQVSALATATATHLGISNVSMANRVEVNDDYLGDGYAMVGETEREAIQMVAQLEGILLDPVYTGRAMGGLIDLIRWGAFTRGQSVLFWHTGGAAALPAFVDKLL
jgi:D-cysteine desulfhydrase family pyridoxal phosphate-dependent enzyme